ncbi:alpha-1-2-Mannosidase [Pyrenophora teres f. teres]|nr:alpha-1-2-Mannosidase [Pyrenophora teres f. teres]
MMSLNLDSSTSGGLSSSPPTYRASILVSDNVNMFESIIRYLGGFIATYDVSDCKDARLLQKAIEVNDMAYASFDTPNRMPMTRWNPQKAVNRQQQLPEEFGIIAEMASASVEFTQFNVMDEQQSRTKLPGMWPVGVNAKAPDLTNEGQIVLGAMSDSVYEYLPEMYQLLGGAGETAQQYRRMYDYAMTTVIDHSLFGPMVEDKADILVTSSVGADGRMDSSGQHLGGSSQTAVYAYEDTPLDIMLEVLSMYDCSDLSECDYTREPGASPFSNMNDARYILRPEAIESVFHMYRITGDSTYQDKA